MVEEKNEATISLKPPNTQAIFALLYNLFNNNLNTKTVCFSLQGLGMGFPI
jgi:hypothetical protein